MRLNAGIPAKVAAMFFQFLRGIHGRCDLTERSLIRRDASLSISKRHSWSLRLGNRLTAVVPDVLSISKRHSWSLRPTESVCRPPGWWLSISKRHSWSLRLEDGTPVNPIIILSISKRHSWSLRRSGSTQG